MSFLVLLQEQFYPEGLSVFTRLDKVKTESQGFSRTDCNFQGLEFLFQNSKIFKVRENPVNRKLSLEVTVTDQDISGTEYNGNRVRLLCIIR